MCIPVTTTISIYSTVCTCLSSLHIKVLLGLLSWSLIPYTLQVHVHITTNLFIPDPRYTGRKTSRFWSSVIAGVDCNWTELPAHAPAVQLHGFRGLGYRIRLVVWKEEYKTAHYGDRFVKARNRRVDADVTNFTEVKNCLMMHSLIYRKVKPKLREMMALFHKMRGGCCSSIEKTFVPALQNSF